jgi:hypothetical protein
MAAFSAAKALFYGPSLAQAQLKQIILGVVDPPADAIDFTDETGGEVARELAIPLLPGMDDVEVAQAELRLRAKGLETPASGFAAVNEPGGKGVFLSLPGPGLLKKVTVEYAAPVTPHRLVVRGADKQGSSFSGGVPLFAHPTLGKIGDMYGPALPGFVLTEQGSNRRVLTLPSVSGSAWLIQVAQGDKPDELTPLALVPRIVSVVLDSVPKDLAVTLVTDEGEVTLWSNPGLLMPSEGEQIVSFTPLAQRHLAAALNKATPGAATLPVSLKFRTQSAGRVEITSKELTASYVARPFGADKHTVRMAGDRSELAFEVPAGLSPSGNSFRLTVRTSGRERDAASPETPPAPPAHGLQAAQATRVAAGMPVAGSERVGVARLYLAVPEPAEAVVEFHADAAGSPGEVIGKPAVRQLAPAPPAWIDFSLPSPVALEGGTIWLALRTNKGSALWFADASAAGAPAVSTDQGRTWGVPESPIAAAANLMAQILLEAQHPGAPLAAPVLRLEREGTVLDANLLAQAVTGSPGEYSVAAAQFAVNALSAPAATTGRVMKRFELASTSIADVTIEEFVLTYDPGQPFASLGV